MIVCGGGEAEGYVSVLDVSLAECGTELCNLIHLEDSLCSQPIDYTHYGFYPNYTDFMGYYDYYTPQPNIYYTREGDSCGNATANWFNQNDWSLVQNSSFYAEEDKCILSNPSSIRNLTLVVKLSNIGSSGIKTLQRLPPDNTVLFARSQAIGTWLGTEARLSVQLTRAPLYPQCCDFPNAFIGGAEDAYTFHQDESFLFCDSIEAMEYVSYSTQPTTILPYNLTMVEWVFDITHPTNQSCGGEGNELTDPFTISLLVPYRTAAPTTTARNITPTSNIGVVVGMIVGFICILFILLLLALATRTLIQKQREKKDRLSTAEREPPEKPTETTVRRRR